MILLLISTKDHDKDLASPKDQTPEDIVIHQASEKFVPPSDLELPLMSNSLSIRSHHYETIPTNIKLKAVIEAKDLKKVYPECPAVNGMTFQIYEKEIFW